MVDNFGDLVSIANTPPPLAVREEALRRAKKIYNLNHDYTKKIQYEWFKHIKKCGIQCQISFNLLRQIYEDYIGEFKYNINK